MCYGPKGLRSRHTYRAGYESRCSVLHYHRSVWNAISSPVPTTWMRPPADRSPDGCSRQRWRRAPRAMQLQRARRYRGTFGRMRTDELRRSIDQQLKTRQRDSRSLTRLTRRAQRSGERGAVARPQVPRDHFVHLPPHDLRVQPVTGGPGIDLIGTEQVFARRRQ